MKRATRVLATLALLLSAVNQTKADVTFDTTPSWDGSSSIQPWGSVQAGNTATFGQTFIAPTGASTLQDFTFYVNGGGGAGSVTFQADVFAWSGALTGDSGPQGATGPALYTSANMTFTDNGTFQAVTITTGGTVLTPGAAYIALLTTSDPTSIAANGNSVAGFSFGDILHSHVPNDGGGGFNFYNNSTSSQLNTTSWDDFVDFGDSAWKADFVSSVPEPSGFALLGMGVVCLAIGYASWASCRKLIHQPSISG